MTTLRTVFEWLEAMPMSTALRESIFGYPILLTSHVVSMCLIAGLLVMMDLRLTGMGNLHTPVSHIQNRLFKWQMLGLAMSVVSGGLLFYGQPMRFYGNFWFWMKNLLLLAGAGQRDVFPLDDLPFGGQVGQRPGAAGAGAGGRGVGSGLVGGGDRDGSDDCLQRSGSAVVAGPGVDAVAVGPGT